MLSADRKKQLRHVALVGIMLSFPLLYLGAVTLEQAALTTVALVTAGVSSVIAWLAF